MSPWTISTLSIGMPSPSDDQLGEGRLVPLAVAVRAGQHRHAAGRVDADRGAFEEAGAGAERADDGRGRDAAGLDIGGDADAAQFAARRRLAAPLLEALVIGRLQRELQGRDVIAAVVLQRDRGLVGVGVLRDEIAAAQLGRVHAELVGREVDDALEQEGRLGAARAAIGVDRHGVGEDRLGLDIDRRGRVGAGEQGPVEIGRDAGRKGRQIGAHIGDRRDLERRGTWPRASSASSTWVTWSRPCASDMKLSERSAVHLTGRLSLPAAQVTIASSA